MAAALGVSPSAVHKWTRGGEIEYANLLALARFLNVNWLWLRYGDRALADLGSEPDDRRPRPRRPGRKHIAAIMESEARMTFAQEISGVVTWEWNLLTDAVAYSPNVARLFGRPIRTLEDFWQCVLPEDVPGVQAAVSQNLSAGGVYEHVISHCAGAGRGPLDRFASDAGARRAVTGQSR
ncbi:helix-turn-helix domain-containing protein [Cupriavidus basilensis]